MQIKANYKLSALHRAQKAERDEGERRAKQQKEEAEARKEAAKLRYIDEWIAAHGTDSERERQAAGMLCRETIIARIAAAAFHVNFGAYRRLQKVDVALECECAEHAPDLDDMTISYDVVDAPCAVDEEWELLRRIRAAYPAATCTLIIHTASLDCGNAAHGYSTMERKSIKVALPVGPFTFTREFEV